MEIRKPSAETDASGPIPRFLGFGIPSDLGFRGSDLSVPRTLGSDLQQLNRLSIPNCVQIGLSLTTALARLHEQELAIALCEKALSTIRGDNYQNFATAHTNFHHAILPNKESGAVGNPREGGARPALGFWAEVCGSTGLSRRDKRSTGSHAKSKNTRNKKLKGSSMLRYALIFLVVAIIASVLGFGRLSGTAAWIAKVLVVVFLVLFVVSLLRGKK